MENGVGEFSPLYDIEVPVATKTGETLEFLVKTIRKSNEESSTVTRVYEDFAWFLHCLNSQDNVTSVIFPPLPPRPIMSINTAEKLAKKQIGSSPGVLVGDDFTSMRLIYQHFLFLCSNHPRLGHSPVLEKFLMEKEAPARVKVRRNIFDSLKKTYDDKRTSMHKETNGELQQVKMKNEERMRILKHCISQNNKIINSTHRISAAYAEIQTALLELSTISTNSKDVNENSLWCEKTANACEYSSELYKKSAVSQSRNILATIQLHEGFSKSQQDMLQKRIYKAIDLENARKSFEKSKASKKQQAENEMNRIDGELKEMTSLAMPELKRHDKQRVRGWQSSLMEFSNDQVKVSKEALSKLTEIKNSLV